LETTTLGLLTNRTSRSPIKSAILPNCKKIGQNGLVKKKQSSLHNMVISLWISNQKMALSYHLVRK
jgi:hypothetical protein